jgi:hypothetical protein
VSTPATPAFPGRRLVRALRGLRGRSPATHRYEFQFGELPAHLQTEEAMPGSRQPLSLHTLLHEGTLRRGADHAQLCRVTACAQLPNVTLQIVPDSHDPHSWLSGSLVLLSFGDRREPGVAILETLFSRSRTQDARHLAAARQSLDRIAAFAMSPAESLVLLRKLAAQEAPSAPVNPGRLARR